MKKFEPTLEHAFYFLAVVLAVGLRFLHLGALPLSDFEANWALQAMRVTQGMHPVIGPNPAYVHLTAILFYIFSGTNFLARFWPALAGSALIPATWLLRSRIGRIPAIVLAFGLAIDPGLVGISRLAGGPMLAISCLVLAGLFWMDDHQSLCGLFVGLALLSGPSVWFGLLGLVLAWAFITVFGIKPPSQAREDSGVKKPEENPEDGADEKVGGEVTSTPEVSNPARQTRKFSISKNRSMLAWGLGTLLVVGSLLVLSPLGLPALLMSFVDFLRGWWTLSGVPLWKLLLALPAYEILPLGFGIAGIVRGFLKRDADSIRLGTWAMVALVLAVVYPGKQTSDLAWALLPLWTLAAIELGHHFDFAGHNFWELGGVMVLVDSLLVFGWLNLASVTTLPLGTQEANMRLSLMFAVVLLISLSLVLVRAGWSAATARLGGIWSGMLALTAFTVAMSTGAAGIREPLTMELWQPEPRAGRLDVLLKVANQISDLNSGATGSLPLTILGVNSPALDWLFRDWQVQKVDELAPDATPEMIISSVDKLSLTANYRGEALPLTEAANWAQATPSDWLKWFIYRQMPILRQNVILWVRSDLMLDSQGLPTP